MNISKLILQENLIDAKKLIENHLAKTASEIFDAKKNLIIAEKFNGTKIDYKRFLRPRLTKESLRESLDMLNESPLQLMHSACLSHGFEPEKSMYGSQTEYKNQFGHEIHLKHADQKWYHFDPTGEHVATGEGGNSLHMHLSKNGLNEAVKHELEHPYSGIAKEFGFKQVGPTQTKVGVSSVKMIHPATKASLLLYTHHDVNKHSFIHKWGANHQSGAGEIQLRNRLESFHKQVGNADSTTGFTEGAFKKLETKLEKKGESKKEAGAVAYLAGKKKFGKAGMAKKAAEARRK